MDWSQLAPDFQADGSLRDIYVLRTSLSDWALVWRALMASPDRLSFSIDGEAAELPLDIKEIFGLRDAHSIMASFAVGNQRLNCHFFDEGEIEFDLDPRHVNGLADVEPVVQFIVMLGRAVSKEVRLTPENAQDLIIARYDPVRDEVIWNPLTD